MQINDFKLVSKDKMERYDFRFNGGDCCYISISEDGLLMVNSSHGDYSYKWCSIGDRTFKEFLCDLNKGYLLSKLTQGKQDMYKTYFSKSDYIDLIHREIIKLRKDDNLTKDEARESWNFFDDYILADSPDLIINQISKDLDENLLKKLFGYDFYYSDILPEYTYDLNLLYFVENVFPKFQKFLKDEIEFVRQVSKVAAKCGVTKTEVDNLFLEMYNKNK